MILNNNNELWIVSCVWEYLFNKLPENCTLINGFSLPWKAISLQSWIRYGQGHAVNRETDGATNWTSHSDKWDLNSYLRGVRENLTKSGNTWSIRSDLKINAEKEIIIWKSKKQYVPKKKQTSTNVKFVGEARPKSLRNFPFFCAIT